MFYINSCKLKEGLRLRTRKTFERHGSTAGQVTQALRLREMTQETLPPDEPLQAHEEAQAAENHLSTAKHVWQRCSVGPLVGVRVRISNIRV